MHSFYKMLAANPPYGYEFTVPESPLERVSKAASKNSLSYAAFNLVDRFVPVNLARSHLRKWDKLPPDIDLTYAFDHLVFRKEPWVLDVEYVSLIAGYNVKHFARYKKTIERSLNSEYCRKIICGTEAAKRSLVLNLNGSTFEKKVEVVPFATRPKHFTKQFTTNRVKLLFVGSANILGQFEIKGGRETMEAFSILSMRCSDIELVVRSDVPSDIRKKYGNRSDIKIIDRMMRWEELEQEFKSADIFLLPVHNTPYSVFLDAMSYELPIITIDAWANPEIVEDGKTGLLAKKSSKVPYYVERFIPNFGTPQFKNATSSPDPEVVQDLVEKTAMLIETPEIRRRLGKAGRWKVEHGEFSLEHRNERLKRILDEATA
jgi:glycosyltransferase involved in cell wall biosynthesis